VGEGQDFLQPLTARDAFESKALIYNILFINKP
jgi:hypothetical protein